MQPFDISITSYRDKHRMASSESPRQIARLPKRMQPAGAFARLSVAHIPAEVLVVIFIWLEAIVKFNAAKSIAAWQTGIRINSWIFVTHVCRDWRQVALQYEAFWCKINSVQPLGLIKASLSRSKNMPLSVRIAGTSNYMVVKVLLENLPRIRDLTIALAGPWHLNSRGCFETLRGQPTPLLESISVFKADPVPPSPSPPPFPILLGPHPVLKSVNLLAFPIPWDSLMLHSLTQLGIGCMLPEYQPTLTQIRSILVACPQLSILGLVFSAPTETDDPQHAKAQLIHLPHLSSIRIEMYAQSWALLLQQLSLTHEFKWKIKIPHFPSRMKDRLIPTGDLSATGQTLVVTVLNNGVEVYQESMSDPGANGTKQKIGLVWPEVGPNERISAAFENIAEIAKNTSWANATALQIHFTGLSVDEGKPIGWKKIFEVFTGLDHLSLSAHVLNMANPESGLAEALSTPQKLVDGTTSFLLPNLRTLHMRNTMRSASQVQAFGRCFQTRRGASPLQELILMNNTSLSRVSLQNLKENVKVVKQRDDDLTDGLIERRSPRRKQNERVASHTDDSGSEDWEECTEEDISESESD
ncbi:hypothetical protein BD410DRAFT_830656 [Rickenella mellea]|uniref:F-box domain-containing protein n=1 Tax=Rickenella mellea TaxID=50990 RepID=A0A4Y7PV50_9AGAM|nr:hypothetical protein BD410DRAFT_830656 [Rickenella mellea]